MCFAGLVFEADPGTEEDFVGVARGAFYDLEFVQAVLQKAHPGIDFAQAPLAINVVAIF